VIEPGPAATLADLVLVVHALFVGFVVLGQIAIVAGLLAGRAWARHFGFRLAHLACVVFVVVQTWLGYTCPLTSWENALRARAGQEGYATGFVADWLRRLIFYEATPQTFVVAYTVFGLLVVGTWILGRPRRRA
jgi:hypothetical protein